MSDLSDLVLFYAGQVKKFYLDLFQSSRLLLICSPELPNFGAGTPTFWRLYFFFSMAELPLFGKEGSETPVSKPW